MEEPLHFDIRYTQVEDESFLYEWISDPETNRWLPMSTDEEIRQAAKNWIGFSRFQSSLTGTIQGKPAAIGTLF